MADFSRSYLGRLRQIVGRRLILMPGARLVLWTNDDKILLQRRSDFGKWALISGIAEEGESLTETIIREAKEEVGLNIKDPVPFGFSSKPALERITYPNRDQCQFFAVMYACDTFFGEPCSADDETTDVRWFSMEVLPDNCMPSVALTIAAFQRWQHTCQFQNIDAVN